MCGCVCGGGGRLATRARAPMQRPQAPPRAPPPMRARLEEEVARDDAQVHLARRAHASKLVHGGKDEGHQDEEDLERQAGEDGGDERVDKGQLVDDAACTHGWVGGWVAWAGRGHADAPPPRSQEDTRNNLNLPPDVRTPPHTRPHTPLPPHTNTTHTPGERVGGDEALNSCDRNHEEGGENDERAPHRQAAGCATRGGVGWGRGGVDGGDSGQVGG